MEVDLVKRGHRASITLTDYLQTNTYAVSLGTWITRDLTSFNSKVEFFESKREATTLFRKLSNMLQSDGYKFI